MVKDGQKILNNYRDGENSILIQLHPSQRASNKQYKNEKIIHKDNKKGIDKSYEMTAENILEEATISGYKIISKKVLKEKNGWRTMVLLEYNLI